jgi:hypothetical protein
LSELPTHSLPDIARLLVGITGSRLGPEALPASPRLLVVTVLASVLVDAIQLAVLPDEYQSNPVGLIAVGVVTTLLWYGVLLRVAGKPERYVQTLTAVFGVQLVLAPALVSSGWFLATYLQDPTWKMPAALFRLIVEIWVLVVLARVLRAATGWPVFACVALTLAGELLNLLLIANLFPQPVAAVTTPV